MRAAGQGIGILADDLTGACDTALPFFRSGASVQLVTHLETLASPSENSLLKAISAVLAINVATRHKAIDDLAAPIQLAVGHLQAQGIERTYLKIDSTLRGPVGAFCWHAAEALGADLVVIAPALPTSNRQTVGGYQLVSGQPVERSPAGRDPRAPVGLSYIPSLLLESLAEALPELSSEKLQGLIGTISLSTVIRGAAPILAALLTAHNLGQRFVVVDATSETDLEQLALALEKASQKMTVIPCGSAGFATALSSRWVDANDTNPEFLPQGKLSSARCYGRCIVLMGSNTPLSHEQLEATEGLEGIKHVLLNPEVILGLESLDNSIAAIKKLWEENKVPIVTTAWPLGAVSRTLAVASEHQLSAEAVYERLNYTLTQLSKALVQVASAQIPEMPLTCWASGGDTAESFVSGIHAALSNKHLLNWELMGETRSGIPVLSASTHIQDENSLSPSAYTTLPLRLLTRSGNFGTSTTLHSFLSRWLTDCPPHSSLPVLKEEAQ